MRHRAGWFVVDSLRVIETAQRLIKKDGRAISLVRFNETPQNEAQPWLGPSDPRSGETKLAVDAVFVPPGSVGLRLGLAITSEDLLKNSEQIAITSPGATVDLAVYQEIEDGATRWKITNAEVLKPGNAVLLAFIGVAR